MFALLFTCQACPLSSSSGSDIEDLEQPGSHQVLDLPTVDSVGVEDRGAASVKGPRIQWVGFEYSGLGCSGLGDVNPT
jgi:hypothetical protein